MMKKLIRCKSLAVALMLLPAMAWGQDGQLIRLNSGAFDPLVAAPQALIDSGAAARSLAAEDAAEAIYIVQFNDTPSPAEQSALAALGAKIHAAFEDNALIVRMDPTLSHQVAARAAVRWVGPFLADYRLEQPLYGLLTQDAPLRQAAGATRYVVLLFENDQGAKDAVTEEIRLRGGEVHVVGGGRIIEASFDISTLRDLAGMNEVLYVERWTPAENDMDLVRAGNGANYVETIAGYSGQGVRGEVFDDGVRITHNDFQSNPPLIHGANDSDFNHGTLTYGIVFGDGASNSRARGMLPDAEQPIFSSRNRSFNRFDHTAELVDPNGPYRAVFQTNSWGSGRTTTYTAISADMDDIIFDLDILITQSQSNAGNRDSRPQAWAKNIVSVGGIQGFDTATRNDDRWGGRASIGPASDGRIKPDLSQFYGDIFTTSETGDSAHRDFGGTSGATPAAVGHFGLMFQMWADGVFSGAPGQARDVFDSRPHSTTAKALMINTAFQYDFNGANVDRTRVHQGWGFPDVRNLYDAAEANGWRLPILIDETEVLNPGETHSYALQSEGLEPLKATMVYLDLPGLPNASVQRVNDLTLKATSPSGTIYWGNNGLNEGNWSVAGGTSNQVDTVENIFIETPEAGVWTIEVIGDEIVQDSHVETAALDADYALVVVGGTTDVGPQLPDVTVVASDASASEAGLDGGAYTVSRSGDTGAVLTVRYTVSGTATAGSDYQALSGTATIPAGQASAVVAVTPIDDLELESDETVSLALSADAAYEVGSPSNATVTIASDEFPPTLTIAATTPTATEAGPVSGVFTVSRAGDASAALTIGYTVAGTATAGGDYGALSGSVSLAAGETAAVISVVPIDDNEIEPDETVLVTLSADAAYELGTPDNAAVTIVSDEVLPTVTIAATDATATEAGTTGGSFTVTRSQNSNGALTVRYAVSGSATPGSDYAALSGSVSLAAGQNSASIPVTPIDDNLFEADETVVVTLSADPAYGIGTQASGAVTIESDDLQPVEPVTLSVVNLFDNKNGKNYFAGGPAGTDPLDDINTLAEEDKLEVLGDDPSFWWEADYADPDTALGDPLEVIVTLNYRPEQDWSGTFTVEYRVGGTVLASTTLPGNSAGDAESIVWDLSSVVTTSGDLANGRLRFLNSDLDNGKKVFVSFSSTSATLGGGSITTNAALSSGN